MGVDIVCPGLGHGHLEGELVLGGCGGGCALDAAELCKCVDSVGVEGFNQLGRALYGCQ